MISRDGQSQDLKISVVVVEVQTGESKEEAWRRYLSHHPESAGGEVKIFHYPNSSPANHKGLVPKISGLKRISSRCNFPTLAIFLR
ncbi:MAG: hypothetical protein QME75_06930 [Deltaproteobacteria bacterium]|nr:hypothetical protein [Deltaproteobacteria bacterium]